MQIKYFIQNKLIREFTIVQILILQFMRINLI